MLRAHGLKSRLSSETIQNLQEVAGILPQKVPATFCNKVPGMKTRLLCTLLLCLSLTPAPPQDAGRGDFSSLDAVLTDEFAKDGIGGASIGVVRGDKLVWTANYGYADMDARRRPSAATGYRIGSVTKQFTALMLMQLVEDGKARLTDPVRKYYPEIDQIQKAHAGSPPITLLQVATMMSGLSREPDGPSDHSVGPVEIWEKKVAVSLPQTTYAHEPGTQYLYSNIGYASLGVALSRAAGQPFTAFIETHIIRPLQMSRTAFAPTADLRTDLATGYTRRDGKPEHSGPDREMDGRGYRVPNGALISTVADLAKFVAWELGEGPAGILNKDTQTSNYSRVYSANSSLTSGYGLGFQATRRGDLVALGHGGSTAGFRASVLFQRDSKTGVIVLRNAEGGSFDAGAIALRVLERAVASSISSPQRQQR
jgi:CubicO group peptidase (beta-lactamase class C family)